MGNDHVTFTSDAGNKLVWAGNHIVFPSSESFTSKCLQLTRAQQQELPHYLKYYQPFSHCWGEINPLAPVLAFSYGEGDEVNVRLADVVSDLLRSHLKQYALVQWEIAAHIERTFPELSSRVTPLELAVDQDYMTTQDVALLAYQRWSQRASVNVNPLFMQSITIVAQAWHVTRCVRQAELAGFSCQAVRVIDAFAPNDPQPWVRHPLDWIIKESRMRYLERQACA